jgi:large repetitive protein
VISSSRSRTLAFGAFVLAFLVGVAHTSPSGQEAVAAPLPTLSVDDVTITEGSGGTVSVVFHVTQNKRGKSAVRYATREGTAKAPGDFVGKSGQIRFAGNKLTKNVSVTVVGDTLDEANETFFLELSNPVGATITDDRGEATITDDDASPTLSIVPSMSVPEGNTGDQPSASLDVTLSAVSGRDVSVSFATVDATATTADGDYVAKSGTIDFAPGDTQRTILVTVVGDDDVEMDETFDVQISSPVHATLGNATAVVTITGNDPIPPGSAILNVTGASVREGALGTTRVLTFTIVRSGETTTAVNVDFATTNGSATDPSDYLAASGTVAFGANETSETVDVTIVGDRRLERNETFFLSLLDPSAGAEIDSGQAAGRIVNDDTRTSLVVTKGAHRILARGRLSPARPGNKMVVRLFRKRNGVWVRLQSRRPVLRGRTDLNGDGFTDSAYRTRFGRPRPGTCRVIAQFVGGTTFASSKAVRVFRC